MPGLALPRLEPDIQAAPSGLSEDLALDAWVNPRIKSGGIISSNAGENAVRPCMAMIQLSFSGFMTFIVP
jgi:hypothetical protein